jgi:outer membrane protein
MQRKDIVLVFLLGLVASMAALAQPPDPNKPQGGLGLAVINSTEPYRGADGRTRVVPAITFSYKRFYFRGIYAGFTLLAQNGIKVDLVARPRFGGYDEEDSPFLDGMDDRRISADLGFRVEREGEYFNHRLTPVTDVLDRSGGQEVGLDIVLPLQRGPFRIEPRIGAVWLSEDSADYYFGVRPAEARPGRPAYVPGATVNLTAGVFGFAPVGRKWVAQGVLELERLGEELQDGPLVDQDLGLTAYAGLSYQF